jgi:putative transcriptional regulator
MAHIETNIAYLRATRRLTQKEVAQATGIGQKTLSALETGASQGIEFNTLVKLCTFFRCAPSDVLLIEEEEEIVPPSPENLQKAEALIQRAMEAAKRSPTPNSRTELWSEFETLRTQLQNSVESEKTSSGINRRVPGV